MKDETRLALQRYDIPIGLGSIIVFTAIFAAVPTALSTGAWAMLYLPIVFLVGYFTTTRAGIAAAILAAVGWMYFLVPPYRAFLVESSGDAFTMAAMLVFGILVAIFAGRRVLPEIAAIPQAHPKPIRALDTALLNKFSAQLVSQSNIEDAARSMLESLKQATGAQKVTMYLPDEIGRLRPAFAYPDEASKRDPLTTAIARWVSNEGRAFQIELREITSDEQHEWLGMPPPGQLDAEYMGDQIFVPVQTASFRAGVLHLSAREDGERHTIENDGMMLVISNLLAAFLERRRALNQAKKDTAKPSGAAPQVRPAQPADKPGEYLDSEVGSIDSQLERLNEGMENLLRNTNPPTEEEPKQQ